MGPPDRVDREGSAYKSRAVVRRISARQRQVALENGCAYFDLQEAMGGEGAATRWAHHRPRLISGDMTHPTPEGAARIGEMIVQALTAGL
jgi:lysophospholipase L1-like esterase